MTDRLQSRLLKLAGGFLALYAIILTLSPAVRMRTWQVSYRWEHWIGLLVWAVCFAIANYQTSRLLPDRDPFLLPITAVLSGWGLLLIWRLVPSLGMRQTIWLLLATAVLTIGLRLPANLRHLRNYKYLLLFSGLLLTALTLFFGANPLGYGPQLWLGYRSVFLQPSEPLKLLLVIYLAAYLSDRIHLRRRLLLLTFPTILVIGLSLLLLLVQRDLGTASIFIGLYTMILYMGTARRRFLLICFGTLLLAGILGYFTIDIVRLRVDTWLNPWADPSGTSYQIVQSLLAIANGGLLGRGPGLGSPGLVPVAHSDFIFAALAEEHGLMGTAALLMLYGLLINRGFRAALNAQDRYRRILAAGLTTYLGIQTLLIVGGNLRLLPLTGVTLPFVSYGGSSLITGTIAILLLLLIGSQPDDEPAPLPKPSPYLITSALLLSGLLLSLLANSYWGIIRSADLLTRTDNPRRSIADRYVPRGQILDRDNRPINMTDGQVGEYKRSYLIPELGSVIGYTHPIFGQAGLEASLDNYLRGLQGNPVSLVLWNQLLYGQPPEGLDVRLSIDLELQAAADQALKEHTGALVLIDASTGDILVISSHPTFDPNLLDQTGNTLIDDPDARLLNRVTLGSYPIGRTLKSLFGSDIESMKTFGLFEAPRLRMGSVTARAAADNPTISPLQAALAAAVYSAEGIRPPARITTAIKTSQSGWVILPALGDPKRVLSPSGAADTAESLMIPEEPFWQVSETLTEADSAYTWYLAGTLPNWQATPLTIVLLLEEDNEPLAVEVGSKILKEALQP
ncbi:MAG: FtsW/RodA/SpoVE family cell cycle protein [Anaerolineales bacterium]|nr:FtsW/RodA/SpoVE family cell cycle protein [Anaerolineales bacterium]